ncbi:MAG: T9SS type A sorting domain-containing protein [Cytophagales bacterium]
MNKILYTSILFLTFSVLCNAQSWYELRASGANFHDIRKAYDEHIANQNQTRVNKPFERWAHRMNEITWPNGELSKDIPNYYLLRREMANKSTRAKSSPYPQWTNLGPSIVPFGGGNGRLNFIKFRPDSTNVLFVGAPAGGLWKSTNGGQTFILINDTLPVLGCSDLAIDPVNNNIMYLATGDRDGSDTYSIGVLKSFDGGLTWDTTGLHWIASDQITIGRLDINPQNEQMIVAASSDGFYKSVNGGLTWSRKRTGNFKDVHFKPGDSSVIYISSNEVLVSNDAGESFSGTNVSGFFNRIELAVTEDDPNYVYALGSQGNTSRFESLWRSTNSGQSWTNRFDNTSGVNLLGGDADGGDNRGQGWYDLALAVSPIDKDRVVVGGINVWESLNGGGSFGTNSISHWTGNGATYIHADQHDLVFKPNSGDLYAANDGGIFYTTDNGSLWTDLTETLQITQSYRLGISQNTAGFLQAGNQDNGTIRRNLSGTYLYEQVNGGDGMETIIDHTDDNITYSATQNGSLYRAVSGAYSGINNNINEGGYWETPYIMDPFQNNIIFAGFNNIFKTSNADDPNPGSILWVKRNNSSYPSSGKTTQLAMAPWNLDMLMAAKGSSLYLSSDGGVNWSLISGSLPNLFITNIQFSPYFNPGTFTAYVTLSGYSNGNKVYRTIDGGQSWQNISTGLPNVPAQCIVIDPTTFTTEELYVGTDVGVFYKNDNMSQFEAYSNGLPNVWVQEMEVQVAEGYIYACTYGRGLWKVPLYSTLVGFNNENLAKNESVELSVFPNPFTERLEIKYDLKEQSEVFMEILDLQGKQIYSYINTSPQMGLNILTIDSEMADLSKGMYIIKFKTGSEEITRKIIKN